MKLLDRFLGTNRVVGKTSFSQCGEDLIIEFALNEMHIEKPAYLDIGAYHASDYSNTYLFYQKGFSGVCVEPDPILFAEIQKARKRDICLNVGVGFSEASVAEFYVMSCKTLNTFSKEEAERYQSYGSHSIEEVVRMPLLPVNTILEKYFTSCPDFISIDAEGLDLEILNSFDFSKFRPAVFCVETITYTEDRSEQKVEEVIDVMRSRGYFSYADTYINTIFVETEIWRNR